LYFLSADLSIRITRPGEDITLERDGNGWVTMSCPTNDCSAAQKTHYHYDANGARVRKVRGIAGQERLYPWPWLEVHPDGSGLHELHYFAGSRRIATVRRSGNASAGTPGSYLSARYYHSDHVGSNTLVTRSDGSTVQESVLDPFGELLHQPLTSASNAYLFTDQVRDEQTGLDYFGARYYDPWVGRFMSVDPESLGGVTFNMAQRSTQAMSPYSYVLNRPTVYVDPTGRQTEEVWFRTEVPGGDQMVRQSETFMNETMPDAVDEAIEDGVELANDAADALSTIPPGTPITGDPRADAVLNFVLTLRQILDQYIETTNTRSGSVRIIDQPDGPPSPPTPPQPPTPPAPPSPGPDGGPAPSDAPPGGEQSDREVQDGLLGHEAFQ